MKKKFLCCILAVSISLPFVSVDAAKNMGYKWPVPGYYMTNPFTGTSKSDHRGIDIATSGVAANVYAAKSGTIMKFYNNCEHISQRTSCNDGIGNGMMIDHGDGTFTQYAHMTLNSFPSNIYVGAYVEQGQFLGKVGSSGMSTGYHLHFELRTGTNHNNYWSNTPVNALDYMDVDDTGNYSGGGSVTSSVSVTTTDVKNISETNATVYGQVSYSGSRPSEVGIYFGTSSTNMNKVARDSINHNKNPFDMWYDLNAEAGQYLSPGTTYYWQCYAIVDGNETKGEVKSFTSKGPTPVNSSVSVTTTDAQNISETNATVYGKVSYSGSRPSEVGIYFGTSSTNMNKVARDSINHNKNPFDMWYDLNAEAGQYLSPGITYYWQCYAIVDGNETKGEVKSFISAGSTPAPIPTATPTPSPTPLPIVTPTPTPAPAEKETPVPITPIKNYSSAYVLTVYSGKNPQIAINDRLVKFYDAQPFIDLNNRTQVPIRAVSEMLNCDVDWISETHTAIITMENGDSVVIVVGSNTMIVNGSRVKMDTTALIKEERTYIPVRSVAEALGLTVEWV